MRAWKWLAVLTVGLVGIQGAMGVPTTIPYDETFEGALGSMWSDANGQVTITAGSAANGTSKGEIDNDTLTLTVDDSKNYTNIWFSVWSKPVPSEEEPAVSGISAAFCLTSNGNLRVYTDQGAQNGWTTLIGGLDTNQWYGFSVHLDYENAIYDLYYTAGAYGTTFTLANTTQPIPFPDGASTELFTASIDSGAGVALVDEVTVTRAYTELVSGTPSPSEAAEKDGAVLGTGSGMHNGNLAEYFAAGNNAMNEELGSMLLDALADGDSVYFYDPTTGNFLQYEVDSLAGSKYWNTHGNDADYAAVPGVGFWIDASGSGDIVLDADDSYLMAYDSQAISSITLNGDDYHFTALSWPFADSRAANSAKGWGFDGIAATGDYILVYNLNTEQYDIVLLWYADAAEWRQVGYSTPASTTLQQGQGFWYYNASAGTHLWNVEAVR